MVQTLCVGATLEQQSAEDIGDGEDVILGSK